MKILKLSQQVTASRQVDSIVGWEDETIYEPIFVCANHIESFSWAGNTRIKMVSGEVVVVSETAEQIAAEMTGAISVTLPGLPDLGSNGEWYQGYAAGAKDMRNGCLKAILSRGISVDGERAA